MPLAKRKLIIISNRLPVSLKRTEDSFQCTVSSGGLVTSLSGLTQSTSFRWFGWPGIEASDSQDRSKIEASLNEHNAVPIFMDKELANDHYNNFCNSILWPILHYQSGVSFEEQPWESYKRVNELFADVIVDQVTSGSLIWVHDYHLMLLPKLLRERLNQKSCAIGFSLHTPFPVWDFWRGLPVRDELVDGILASDLIGFHTDEYKKNFMDCTHSLGANINIPNEIHYQNRLIIADRFIVGIDPQKFADVLQTNDVQKRISDLNEKYKGMKVLLGVDRMDYIKGLPEKLKGYDYFLDQHPELENKVVLIQIAVPSREDVKEYQELEHQVSTIAGRINGKHATPDGTPLIYMHRSVAFPELAALYSVADVCLLASTRDGMNLVSFEYVACQADRHGVLVLSEFAGAATFMKEGSIAFHPANIPQLAEAIYKAVTMSSQDRKERYESLRGFIETNTSAKWGESFIKRLSTCLSE